MGLKDLNPLIKTVAKKAYIVPKMEVRALESFGLKMDQLTGDVVQFQQKSLNQALPEYLYHFTTKSHYENMIKEGFINITTREPTNGVFFHTADNFRHAYKSYGSPICPDGRLDWLRYPLRDGGEAVVLRIPRSALNQAKLHVRDERAFHGLDKDLSGALHYVYQYIIQRKSNSNLTINQFLNTIPIKYQEYFKGKPICDYTKYSSDIPLAIIYDEKIPIEYFTECAKYNKLDYECIKDIETFLDKIFSKGG